MKKLFTLLLLLFVFNFAFAQFAHQNVNLLGTFDDPTVQPESVYGIRYQGCWGYVKPRIDALLNYAGMSDKANVTYVGRVPSSASATGHYKVHEKELEEFLTIAFQ